MMTVNDEITHPEHYTSGEIECIDVMQSVADGVQLEPFAGYLWLNVFKYVFRWPRKGGVTDLKKALCYINRLIDYMEGKKVE